MAKKYKSPRYVKDDLSGAMLEEGIDKIYTMRVGQTIEGANGKNRYIHLELHLGHESFTELVLKKFEAKRIRWIEWLPPTDEEREKFGQKAKGQSVVYDGVA